MATIDERVVSLKFNNAQFMDGVRESKAGIQSLDSSLRLEGATQGIDNVAEAARRLTFGDVVSGAANVISNMGVMEVAGVASLGGIAAKAVSVGGELVKALTIDAAKAGFEEYELQLNSVQTILANTASKGEDINTVNAALDELNVYADQTIYNFGEMTRNIGTFTAAGVGLKESVSAIKGISNLAAASGSSAAQASTAMYQLSQAIASGTVRLMDWNSVQNAGMGGEQMQEALKRTARVHGKAVDEAIAKQGSFRESLQEGWLTSEVMLETLTLMTGDLSREQIIEMGYTEEQTDEIMKFAETANDAATKIKTFSQLIDTLKEELGSGWAQTWRIIFGDFEQAKELWSGIGNYLTGVLSNASKARNELLQAWVDLGGREDVLRGLKNLFDAIMMPLRAIKEAWDATFSGPSAEGLARITKAFGDFTAYLIMGYPRFVDLRRTFQGIFTIFGIGIDIIKDVGQALGPILAVAAGLAGKAISYLGFVLFNITSYIGYLLIRFREWYGGLDLGTKGAEKVSAALALLYKYLQAAASIAGKFKEGFYTGIIYPMGVLKRSAEHLWETIHDTFSRIYHAIVDPFKKTDEAEGSLNVLTGDVVDLGDKVEEAAQPVITFAQVVSAMGRKAWEAGNKLAQKLAPYILELASWLDGTNHKIEEFGDKTEANITEKMPAVIEWLEKTKQAFRDMKDAFTNGLMDSLTGNDSKLSLPDVDTSTFRGQITLAASSLKSIDTSSFTAMLASAGAALSSFGTHLWNAGKALKEFWGNMSIGEHIANGWDNFKDRWGGLPGLIGKGVTAVGKAHGFLADQAARFAGSALKGLGEFIKNSITWFTGHHQVAAMTLAIGGVISGLLRFVTAGRAISGTFISIKDLIGSVKNAIDQFSGVFTSFSKKLEAEAKTETAKQILMYAGAILVLAAAMWVLAQIPADKLLGVSVAIIAVFAGLTASAESIGNSLKDNASMLVGALAMVAICIAVATAAGALRVVAGMEWPEILAGTAALAAIFGMLIVTSKNVGKNKGSLMALGVSAILLGAGVRLMVNSVAKLGEMSLAQLLQGMAALTIMIAILMIFNRVPTPRKNAIGNAIQFLILSYALKNVASVIKEFGEMDWKTYLVGLGEMTGALAILMGVAILLDNIPLSTVGALGLLVVAMAVGKVAAIIATFAAMPWQQYLIGLGEMTGALAVIVAASYLASGSIGGAIALAALAAAISLLVPALVILSQIPLKKAASGLLILAGALAIIIAAGYLAIGAAVGLGALALVLIGLGAGFALAGAGVWLFATGLTLLTVNGAAGVAILAKMIELLPILGTNLAGLLVNFLAVLGENMQAIRDGLGALLIGIFGAITDSLPAFGEMCIQLIGTLLTVIVTMTPQIIQAAFDLLIALIQVLIDKMPEFAEKGAELIIAWLQGIEDHAPDVVEQAVSTISTLATAFSEQLPVIIQTAFDIAINFLNGFADAIRNNSSTVGDACGNIVDALVTGFKDYSSSFGSRIWDTLTRLGRDIINGIKQGVRDNAHKIGDALISGAKAGIGRLKSYLGIRSPSRRFAELGKWTMMGFAKGISDNSSETVAAAQNSAKAVSEEFEKNLDIDPENIDLFGGQEPPVIKPVVDLSEVDKAKEAINGLGASPNLTAEAVRAEALRSAYSVTAPEPQRQNDSDRPKGDVIFNQYNTSPRALSEAEIYRQTRSQLVGLREEIFKL